MTREEKMAVIDGLAEQLNQYPHFYITNIEALNAEQTATLRRKCFENGIKLVVVKNTLFGKALEKVLIGDIVALLQSPAKNVISALQGSAGQKIAGLVKALEERNN